jgi:hypothetical protein
MSICKCDHIEASSCDCSPGYICDSNCQCTMTWKRNSECNCGDQKSRKFQGSSGNWLWLWLWFNLSMWIELSMHIRQQMSSWLHLWWLNTHCSIVNSFHYYFHSNHHIFMNFILIENFDLGQLRIENQSFKDESNFIMNSRYHYIW